MMARTSEDSQYCDEESKRHFEAALRGARNVGHKPMKKLPGNVPSARKWDADEIPHRGDNCVSVFGMCSCLGRQLQCSRIKQQFGND